jgi:glyoxylase-like metal-dependent hydrolase (beta-lactamase superfamily II)
MVSWYRGLGGLVQHRVDTLLAAWVAKKQHGRKRRLGFKRIPPYDDLLRDGQTLPGFPDWQVIANPGHTLHDVSFFHAGQGILYAGDLILSIKGQFVPPVPVLFPDLMCASYARVAALPVRWLLMAHGGVVSLENQPSPFGGMCEKMRGHLRSTYPWIRWITQFPAAVRRARSKKEAFR